jgi:DNA modification methylase
MNDEDGMQIPEDVGDRQRRLVKSKKTVIISGLLGNKVEIVMDKVKDMYGYFPKSVWDLSKDKFLCDLVHDYGDFRWEMGRPCKDGKLVNGKHIVPLSEENPNLAKRCFQMWSDEGDKILNPFVERGWAPILAAYFNRVGYGNDISSKSVELAQAQANKLKLKYKWAKNIHLNCGDSNDILNISRKKWNVGKGEVDYVITDPPYWAPEEYEHVKGQMNDLSSYNEFLEQMSNITGQCYELLKPGKFITYIVGDFRKNGKFYHYGFDCLKLMEDVGFETHDIVINVLRTPFFSCVKKAVEMRRTIKYHGYVLTCKKPG